MKEKKDKKEKVPMKKRILQVAKQTGIGTAGVVGGTALATTLGSLAPFAGLLMLGAGYFLGGKWQVLTVAGAATLSYGIAKSQDNRAADTLGDGFVNFKNDWLHAFYIDKLTKKSEPEEELSGLTIGAIDMSELDDFEEKIKESAIKYQMSQMENAQTEEEQFSETEDEDLEGADFTINEDELDFVNF